ncbi:vacuolar protein sorting-associated protein 9A [Pelomyxa schiedti]|nr:vacuolar protein sorting-associated protein 9A [Pelomyxa schiedti]
MWMLRKPPACSPQPPPASSTTTTTTHEEVDDVGGGRGGDPTSTWTIVGVGSTSSSSSSSRGSHQQHHEGVRSNVCGEPRPPSAAAAAAVAAHDQHHHHDTTTMSSATLGSWATRRAHACVSVTVATTTTTTTTTTSSGRNGSNDDDNDSSSSSSSNKGGHTATWQDGAGGGAVDLAANATAATTTTETTRGTCTCCSSSSSSSSSGSGGGTVSGASAHSGSGSSQTGHQQNGSSWLLPWSWWWSQPTKPEKIFYNKSEFEEIPPKLYDIFLSGLAAPECTSICRSIESFLKTLDTEKCAPKVQAFMRVTFRDLALILGKNFTAVLLYDCLEKYVMDKLYSRVFAPAVDTNKDIHLFETISKLAFILPEHLDIPPSNVNEPALTKCGEILFQLMSARSPLSKILVIIECCRKLFGTLPKSAGADDFLPVLIYTLLRVNPPGLHSNIQYIVNFRAQDKMITEAGYYVVSLYNALAFVESIDASSLTIDPIVFDKNIGVYTGSIPPETEESWVVVTSGGSYVSPTLDVALDHSSASHHTRTHTTTNQSS